MPLPMARPVPPLSEGAQQPLHSRHQIGQRSLQQEMKVIAHEHPGMHPPTATAADISQSAQENQAVVISLKYDFAAVTTGPLRGKPPPDIENDAVLPCFIKARFCLRVKPILCHCGD